MQICPVCNKSFNWFEGLIGIAFKHIEICKQKEAQRFRNEVEQEIIVRSNKPMPSCTNHICNHEDHMIEPDIFITAPALVELVEQAIYREHIDEPFIYMHGLKASIDIEEKKGDGTFEDKEWINMPASDKEVD